MNGECTRVQKLLDVTAVGDTVAGGGLSIAVLLCEQWSRTTTGLHNIIINDAAIGLRWQYFIKHQQDTPHMTNYCFQGHVLYGTQK